MDGWQEQTRVAPKITTVLAGLTLLIMPAVPAGAAEVDGIATGPQGSTDLRIGQDTATLAKRFDVVLKVAPSRGALQNIRNLVSQPDFMLGIVPSDVLDFLASSADDPGLRRTKDALRVVFPLYPEEVHVLARSGIATFADLAGKRVAVGDPDGSTLVTATLLLATAGIRPAEEARLGGKEALDMLHEGRVDAMVEVAGRPAALFRDGVAVEDALHLVPVDLPALRGLYPTAVIPAGTYYPWQPREVPTVAPRAVLVTLDWASREGREGTCRLVGKVARVVADNLEYLRRNGHPKWREVDLGARLPGWERSPCVEQALQGPEGYTLNAPAGPRPSGAAPPKPAAGPAPRNCAAERDPILRRLCEVRPQLEAHP
jgi:TRAP transporter TAXI family solute receptor